MFESAELEQRLSKEEFDEQLPELRTALLDAQERLAESDSAVVIVVAGAEGAGKGEAVNTLLEWLDPRGVEAQALGLPTSEEAERPRFYRFWRRLPPTGRMAVFFGSWYTVPIVQRAFEDTDENEFHNALDGIVRFERMLADEGVVVVKLWLHISKDRQKKVFRKLEANPDTAWRVGDQDWEFHETYDEFREAAEQALRRTDTGRTPWHVISARDHRYCRLRMGQILLETLNRRLAESKDPQPAPEPPPVPAKVNLINSLDLSPRLDDDEYDRRLSSEQGRLGRLARRLSASNRSAVIVFEGVDAAGKGGCIRRITHAIDARWYRVIPIAAPTDEELSHPYLWRFWRKLPFRGQFAIYDRSWYGRVLVERVENLCPPEAWRRAYSEINGFEKQLDDNGILVFKFWLSISAEEQLHRFEKRKETPYKQYKITAEDWRNREKWLAYEAATCDMIERTSTVFAPWHLVSSEDKQHARVIVLQTLCDGLEAVLGPDKGAEKKSKKNTRKKEKKK